MKNKTICIFSSFYPPHVGGVERFVHCLAHELKKNINKIIIVTINTNELDDIEIEDNLLIFRLPAYSLFKNRYPILKINKRFKTLIKQVLSHKPDLFIINLRFYLLSYFSAKLGNKNNIPVIAIEHITGHLTVHNPLLDLFGHYFEHFITKKTKKYVKNFYGVSNACNQWLKHFGIEASGILYNSINIPTLHSLNFREELGITKDGMIFLTATRLLKEKGILLLIEAFEQINIKFPNTFLLVIGDGILYNNLQLKYQKRKNNVFMLGPESNEEVLDIIEVSDIVVIPSYYPEGLPTLVLEAGALGKPVIATDVGGTREIIINDSYGQLIQPKSINELTKAMFRYIEDENYRLVTGSNLKQRIEENFTWSKRATEIMKILNTLT